MSGRVDWPGRGPTWLGVPALVVAVVGGLMWAEVANRQRLGNDLLTKGVETVASSVEVSVGSDRVNREINEVRVGFRAADGREVRTVLVNHEYDRRGIMPEGDQVPAPGTRYAMPLTIVYRPSDPEVVLAEVDARDWVADREAPRRGMGLLAGGVAVVLVALVLVSRDARRRGLAWWQWYTDAPADG